MVSSDHENLVYDLKLSSVGPGKVTGSDVVHHPSNLDLGMKLHYVRGVYFFSREAVQGLTMYNIKEPMFTWLNYYYWTCGRFRRSDTARPFIKCNDCGVRMIEGKCDKTVDEWLQFNDSSLNKFLVSGQIIGPELPYSPPLLLQVTKFKCGGMSVGLSWAHVLGDAFSASDFINMWAKTLAGDHPPKSPHPLYASPSNFPTHFRHAQPLSVKMVDSVGDNWRTPNNSKMDTFSFHINPQQISELQTKIWPHKPTPTFECLCTLFWQSIARIRHRNDPETVTVCRNDSGSRKSGILSNGWHIISAVKADFCVTKAQPKEVAALLVEGGADERGLIDKAVERDGGVCDLVVYGANLTFVNLEDASFYSLELQGQKPLHVSYVIDGVGDEGAVFVLPVPEGGDGRMVTVVLPQGQASELKAELRKEWGVV